MPEEVRRGGREGDGGAHEGGEVREKGKVAKFSRTFSVPRRLHDPDGTLEFLPSRARPWHILFNSLDSINYTGVRLQSPFPFSFSPRAFSVSVFASVTVTAIAPRPPCRPALLNNPVLIPRPRPWVVSRDTGVYRGKPLSVPGSQGREYTWCTVFVFPIEDILDANDAVAGVSFGPPTCNRKWKRTLTLAVRCVTVCLTMCLYKFNYCMISPKCNCRSARTEIFNVYISGRT